MASTLSPVNYILMETLCGDEMIDNSESLLETLRLVGGRLCLDFANTIDARGGVHPRECLRSSADLLRWSHHVGQLNEERVQRLLDEAREHATEATTGYEQALALREAIYRIFSASARGMRPAADDLALLSATYATALTHARIVHSSGGFAWAWSDEENWLDWLLWRLAMSAVELLTSPEICQVKECPGNKGCGWLFLDTSKNGSRHWCSMEGCGSRAKRQRQYERQRSVRARVR
jgi:predicted RNA-binding Zn ribbon-like protein